MRSPGRGRLAGALLVLAAVGAAVAVLVNRTWSHGDHVLRSLGDPHYVASPPPAPARRHVIGAPTPSTLAPEQIAAVVDAHNAWRRKYGVATPLAWDATVGAIAQEWADRIAATGVFRHRPDSPYGENILAWWAPDGETTITPQFAVDAWGGEDVDWDRAAQRCAAGKVCGHFLQIISPTASKVGCGKAAAPDDSGQIYYVCNYVR